MEAARTIKGYELHERIGSGGFGVVHRATQTTVGREVAIKIVLPHFANQPDFIRRFETEAQLIARLEHLHIVPLYDYWRDPDGAYLVMRWLRGGNLRDALANNGSFDLEAAALFLDQITSALAVAHRNGVIHRDLKPANILLDEDGNVYLSDFGIAKDTGKAEGALTGTGMVLGSPDYLSPEQARSEPVTPQTDIYSLGVMLYEVLTGQHPFPNVTSVERMYKHLNEPLPLIESLPEDVSEGVNAIIQKATAKNPAQRYTDVLALAADFRRETALSQRSADNIVEQLTFREQEILQMIVEGCGNKEIAQRLFVTVATVKWHIHGVYQKLRVRSRVQAIVRARELNLIVPETSAEPITGESTYISLPEPENPYKGLRAFQMADARDFFGRDRLVQRLINRLGEHDKLARFLAVVGPSGSGKSSVVKAGLVPALWRGDLPGSDRWFVVEMMPGLYPLDELEIALTRVAANQAGNLREHLERDERGLVRVAGLILPDDDSELVIIVDQFEEVFTLVEDDARRTQFIELLHAAATNPRSRVRVIITLRADFYDRPLHYPDFGELVRSRMETVMPLSADELEEAITKPAARVGVAFEPGLVATITGDVHYQPGALPLLQYALTELFEQRTDHTLTHEAYQTLGGAAGALVKRAEELYHEQDEAGQETIRQMFLRLVSLGEGTEDTRRRVPRSELLAVGGDEDRMDETIDTYAAYRLLTLDHDPATHRPTVEMAHEAILREWGRLRSWLDESRHDIRQQRLLAAAAAEWFQAHKDSSYLLRGARLDQMAGWAAETRLALTQNERHFLETSIAEHVRQENAEQERQQRELETQRQLVEQQRRSATRLRYLVGVFALAAVIAVVLSLFAFGQRNQAQDARATSDTNALSAQRERDYARELALVNGAQAALAKGDIETALALAVAANSGRNPSGQAQDILSQAAYPPGPIRIYPGNGGGLLDAVFSPDGSQMISTDVSGGVILWDVQTAQPTYLEGHSGFVQNVDWSPDGRMALTASTDLSIILWDTETGEMIRRLTSDEMTLDNGFATVFARFSPDGKHILSSTGSGALTDGRAAKLLWWDVETGEVTRTFEGHSDITWGIGFSPDGRTALSGAWFGELILWDVATGEVIRRFGEISDNGFMIPDYIEFSPDGRMALTRAFDGTTTLLWDMETFELIRRFENFPYIEGTFGTGRSRFSPDGQWIAGSGSGLGPTMIWDVSTGEQVAAINRSPNSVDFSPDGQALLLGTFPVTLWDFSYGTELRRYPDLLSSVYDLSPDGKTLLYASQFSYDAQTETVSHIITLDTATGAETTRFEYGPITLDSLHSTVLNIRLSPEGQTALIARFDGRVELWDITTGEYVRTFTSSTTNVMGLAFSPDGRTAVGGSYIVDHGEIILWDVATGVEIRRFTGLGDTIWLTSITFSPDGRRLLAGDGSGEIMVWDTLTGEEIRRYEMPVGAVNTVAFSHDGQMILASGDAGTFLWETETGELLRTFSGWSAIFDATDRTVFTDTGEGGIVQWDITSGEAIRRYQGAGSLLFLHPDGHSFFTAEVPMTEEATVHQWRIDTHSELMAWTLDNRYVRELTCEERAIYRLEPRCDAEGVFPTRTPYLTPVPTLAITAEPTPLPPTTPTPTVPPHDILTAQIGENRGEVAARDYQTWAYEGRAGETLTLRVRAERPWSACDEDQRALAENGCLDSQVIITDPTGVHLNLNFWTGFSFAPATSNDIDETNTDSLVENLVLPADGTYRITVSGFGSLSGGAYTLIIESTPPESITPTPEGTPSGS